MNRPVPIVVLASGRGSNLEALVHDLRRRTHAGTVVGVITDRGEAAVIDVARHLGIDPVILDFARFSSRSAFDDALVEAIRSFAPEWVVLAGFRRLLGAAVIDAFPHRILNLHPSLLPAFPGLHAVEDALRHGAKVTGATVHLVDQGMDTGPIIAQQSVAIRDADDAASLHRRIQAVEHVLLPTVVRAAVEGRLHVHSRKVWLTVKSP